MSTHSTTMTFQGSLFANFVDTEMKIAARTPDQLVITSERVTVYVFAFVCAVGIAYTLFIDTSAVRLHCHTPAGKTSGLGECSIERVSLSSGSLVLGSLLPTRMVRDARTYPVSEITEAKMHYRVTTGSKGSKTHHHEVFLNFSDSVLSPVLFYDYTGKSNRAVAEQRAESINSFLRAVKGDPLRERDHGVTVSEDLSLLDEFLCFIFTAVFIILCLFVTAKERFSLQRKPPIMHLERRNVFGMTRTNLVRDLSTVDTATVFTHRQTRKNKPDKITYGVELTEGDSETIRLCMGQTVDNAAQAQAIVDAIRSWLETAMADGLMEPQTPSGTSPSTCCVCLERDARIAFMPCKHVCTCAVCAPTVQQCPMCRKPIQKREKLFFV
eukprot:TRINITY_DN9106_c0_g2_i1.p1 TRINITY_DN9106_c0_g2~~TRINITY_DN9106_c0_g2_i1.p1  ORF type:complete len:390 (-),score=64.01 TRINITY_DN9106_c0_g2_i1:134-1282(-)